MAYHSLHPRFGMEQIGLIPYFLTEEDPRSAREQFDANYQHGGGWRPLEGWKFDTKTLGLTYPGDPELMPIAFTMLREEKILFYPYAQVMVLQPDMSFEVSRMD